MDRNTRTIDDLLRLLDGLFAPEADRWTADRARDAGTDVHCHCGDAFTPTATDLG